MCANNRVAAAMSAALDNFSVILVETRQGGNIGSAARAMKNMGFQHLKLVAPRQLMNRECRKMAGTALELVEGAQIFPSLDAAVAEENVLVATTSARGRRFSREVHAPRDLAPRLLEYARRQRVGLVFGPEHSGLSESRLAKAQYLVSIPSCPSAPVLNLSQAVLLITYEIAYAPWRERGRRITATQTQREQMYEQMQQLLIRIGFLNAANPDPIMNSIRAVLGRADLTPRDVRILRGVFSQMSWYFQMGRQLDPEAIKKQ